MARKLIISLVALGAITLTASCGAPAETSSTGDASSPIKIGIVPPMTGSLSVYGTDATRAWEYAVAEANATGGIDGRPVELIKAESDGTPAATLRGVREVVSQGGAQFIGGVTTSPEVSAVNAQLAGLNVLSMSATAQDDVLSAKNCNANSFQITQSTSMQINTLAKTLTELPASTFALQVVDYSAGRLAAQVFKEAATKAGKEVVLEQFAPQGTADFGTFIAQIKSSGADGLFVYEQGADSVAFVQQAAQFQLMEQLKTVVGFNAFTEPLFPAIGDKLVGFYGNVGYDVNDDNPQNRTFVAGYEKKYGAKPYFVPADNYLAAQTLFAGIKKAKSSDPAKVRSALEDLTFDSINGEVTLRGADHQLVRPAHLGKIERGETGVEYQVVATAAGAEISPKPSPDCVL